MSVVGGYTKLPPPYPGQANLCMSGQEDHEILNLVDLFCTVPSGQPQVNLGKCSSGTFVNFAQTSQQQVKLRPHTISEADLETANQDVLIRVPGVNPEQANQRNYEVNMKGTDLNGQFVNFAPTGQHHGNQTSYTSDPADPGTANHLDAFVKLCQTDQRQIFTSNEEVNVAVTNVAVTSHNGALVNNVMTSQPEFSQTKAQKTFCPSQAGYFLDNNVGKLSNLDYSFPAGTVIKITQAPVEDDISQDNC